MGTYSTMQPLRCTASQTTRTISPTSCAMVSYLNINTIPSMCRCPKRTPGTAMSPFAPSQCSGMAVSITDRNLSLLLPLATGGVQRLQRADLIVQASKDCVQKTIKRLEEKITGGAHAQTLPAGAGAADASTPVPVIRA
jgi:hypothetical protein